MKKTAIALFCIFLLFLGALGWLHSRWGKEQIKSLISQQMAPLQVEIGDIRGTLPLDAELQNVVVKGPGLHLSAKSVDLKLSLWGLFRKKLNFSSVRATGIAVEENNSAASGTTSTAKIPNISHPKGRDVLWGPRVSVRHLSLQFEKPFAVSVEGRLELGEKNEAELTVKQGENSVHGLITMLGTFGRVRGSATIDGRKGIFSSQFQKKGETIVFTNVSVKSDLLQAAGKLVVENHKLSEATLQFEAKPFTGKITAHSEGEAFFGELQIADKENTGQTDFSWSPGKSLFLPHIVVTGPTLSGSGQLEVRPDFLLIGTTDFRVVNIGPVFGKADVNALWSVQEGVQAVDVNATVTDLFYDSLRSEKATLYANLLGPYENIRGKISLNCDRVKWHDLALETATLETSTFGESWPFKFFAEGKWKHPLDAHIDGFWRWDYQKKDFFGVVQTATGNFFNHPFILDSPFSLQWSKEIFRLAEMQLSSANGTLYANIDRNNDAMQAQLRLKELPLDFLSLNPLDVTVAGKINCDLEVEEKNNQFQGTFKAGLEQVEVAALGNDVLNGAGTFEGKFNKERLDLTGNLIARGEPLFNLDLSLPIHLATWPFEAKFLLHKPATGHVAFQGRVEDFLDFFDLGNHRLEGDCKLEFSLSHTLHNPHLDGTCLFEKGFYQNTYTGTEFRNIYANWIGEKTELRLHTLTAEDPKSSGTLSALGVIHLLPADLFPFQFDVEFTKLDCVQIDLVNATASGKIHIEGNQKSALAKGNVEIVKAEFSIPDHIPQPLPDLKVVYKNANQPMTPPELDSYTPYPLFLDLHVTAPSDVVISGRGLNSEWKGDFQIGGTYTSMTAKGKLDLMSGQFDFSGRTFKLTDGALSLSGKEHEMPYLNIAGMVNTKGVSIIGRLKGPLNNPQATFQSVPPLPLSAIMSYLLFGQDLSEISGFQALQLASSLANLAGTGPDIMESTRRALGVDRLRVISVPSGTEEGETVALQVGKYVKEGVLVSYSQGAEDSSANVSVEIELKDNFVFQIESDQLQEQGKFTLRWTLNY